MLQAGNATYMIVRHWLCLHS